MVITGGNSGIGFSTARALLAMGAEVVIGCRDVGRGEAAASELRAQLPGCRVSVLHCDLADLAVVDAFVEELSYREHIDVLINNAGLVQDQRRETAQGFELVFGTNHLGHFRLTEGLLEQLRAAPRGRIVNLASVGHRMAFGGIQWADINRFRRFDTSRTYADSKLANILHAEALARRLEGTKVVANSVHPGSVHSGFGRDGDTSGAMGRLMELSDVGFALGVLKSPEDGARTSVHLASAPETERVSGGYWARCGRRRVAPWVRHRGDVEQLVENSRAMIAAVT